MTKSQITDFIKTLDRKLLIDLSVRYGLAAIMLFIFLIPSCGRYHIAKTELAGKKAQLQAARMKLSQAQKAQLDRDTIAGEIMAYEDRFFTEEELSQMLGMVSDLAKQCSLQMRSSKPIKEADQAQNSLTPKPPAPPLPVQAAQPALYGSQEFEIELAGGYHSVGKFLNDLRGYKKFIHVKKVSMLGAAAPLTTHEIRLVLKVYLKNQGV